MKECNLNFWKTTEANEKDISLLKFLSELGMIEFRNTMFSYNSLFEVKFTLKERILENGTV